MTHLRNLIMCFFCLIIQINAANPSLFISPISDSLYIQVTSFADHTISETTLHTLSQYNADQAKAIIIDFRHNMGGYIHEAIEFSALFVKTDTLITLIKKNNAPLSVIRPKNHPFIPAKKLIILLDNQTASASEAAISILLNHPNITLIGKPSYGKTIIHTETNPSPYASFKMTTPKIQPDIIAKLPISANPLDMAQFALMQVYQQPQPSN